MKNKNILFKIFALTLCLVMLFTMVSCANERKPDADVGETQETEPLETEPVETMRVVVFSLNAVKGNLLNKMRVELADVPITDLPIDPITNVDDAIGKYLLSDADKGMCVSASMLSITDPLVSISGLGNNYVLYSNVASANPGISDISTLLQKAIDENPGKTIYIPDGKYSLTKPIVIPSEEGRSVSLRLSNYATISPSKSWNSEETALIRYGSADSPKTQSGDHSDYIMGGILDGDGRFTAIEINGGGRLFVNNVSIKDATTGIHLTANAAYNDIENVNVTAPSSRGTKGVFVEGTNNTFVNMRIYRVQVGVHLTGGDNVLENIHPLFSGSNSLSAIGFHDESSGNRFNICYSDQYSIGFKIASHTRSYFDSCYAFWWAACSYQIGFMCEGEFNSILSDCYVSMQNVRSGGSGTQNHFLYFQGEITVENEENEENDENDENEEETSGRPGGNRHPGSSQEQEPSEGLTAGTPSGDGVVINPIIDNPRYSDSDTYKQFLYSVS